MGIFDKLKTAISNSELDSSVLKFGELSIEAILGSGQQGLVLKVQNPIGKNFAVKFYHPLDIEQDILKHGVERFTKEARLLSEFNHKNIVKVYTAGTARFTETWERREGFADQSDTDAIVYYYVMEYLDSSLPRVFPELDSPLSNGLIVERSPTELAEKAMQFEELIAQVCSAMHYYHSREITHKDIKSDNIRYNSDDGTFILVDFGFAKRLTSPQGQSPTIRTQFIDWPSIATNDYLSNDMAMFAYILLRILPGLEPAYDKVRFTGMRDSIGRALSSDLAKRYRTPQHFSETVSQYFGFLGRWNLVLSSDECLTPTQFGRFISKLRIPVSGSIFLTKEVINIIDTQDFQRLRGVRQLGPTMFVFPGANHTRFEHSLGAYHLSLRVLERLLKLPEFRALCEPVNESIKVIVLSSLLHDIGHYPYSHWIEEIDEFPRGVHFPSHEARAENIIMSSSIRKLIENEWESKPQIVANVIGGVHLEGQGILENSIINSAIDIDKVDYILRDSVHCGVEYGKGIDLERLLDSLHVNNSMSRICLTDKGRSCLLALLSCRNIMYQEVYWHKTVRSCDAMLKRFLYEYILRCIEEPGVVEKYFELSDDNFTQILYDKSHQKDPLLARLIEPFAFKGRQIYKPAYIYYQASASSEPQDTRNFFERVLECHSYRSIVNISNHLKELLKDQIPSLDSLDLIIEATPIKPQHAIYELQDLTIWSIRKQLHETLPHEIHTLNEYLKSNRQAYLFCHPSHYDRMRELAISGTLNTMLAEIQ